MSTAFGNSLNSQTLLLLDASSLVIQTGLLREGKWAAYIESKEESLNSLFTGTDTCLKKAQCDLETIDGFILCQGPGSILGLRLTIMAVKTWRTLPSLRRTNLYLYGSLEIAAALHSTRNISQPFHFISDYNKDHWNLLTVVNNDHHLIQVSTEYLNNLNGPIWHIPQRHNVKAPPSQVKTLEYSLKDLPLVLDRTSLFHQYNDLSQIKPGKSNFTKWHSNRHRKYSEKD